MRLGRLPSTLLALAGVLSVTFVCYSLLRADSTTAALALFLAVLFIGANTGRFETVTAAITATLCLDYLFIPPIGSISVTDPKGWVALGVFLAGSLLASNLAGRVRSQRDELISRQREVEKLYALSRSMLLSRGSEDVRRLIVNKCIELFGFTEVALFESATGHIYRSQNDSTISDDRLLHVARDGSIDRDKAEGTTILPVTLGNKNLGSLAFRKISLPDATLQGIASTIAVGLAQAQAQDAGTRAEAIRKSEELKSMMIDALAHDLKTPLTAMQAAAAMLEQPSLTSDEQRRDLIEVIRQETDGLKRMLDEAIHLARIDAKRLKLETEPLDIGEVVQAVLASLDDDAIARRIQLDVTPGLSPVVADKELIVQALKQVLDNAGKYSPEHSLITISATEANGLLSISVRDRGTGLTELEQGRVFEKFYRGRYDGSAVQGTGMGLAIAKEIIEAHGGSLAVESQVGQGSRFTMTLNAASAQPTAIEPQV